MLISGLPTLTEVEVLTIREALFSGFHENPSLNEFHDIQTGIKAKQQIVIFGKHTGLAGYKGANCSTTANSTVSFPSAEKHWLPEYIGDRFTECYDSYMTKFIRWGLKNGVQKPDLTGTELAGFIITQLKDLLWEVAMRHAWFGDTAITNGSPNNLGAGDLKFFNAIDGFWKQLFAIVSGDAARQSTTGLTTKNGQASYALQKFNSTDTTNQVVTLALDQMWYDADMLLRGMAKSDLIYLVTQSVYDQYEKERKRNGGTAILEVFNRQEQGVPPLAANGIEVRPVHFWDRIIQTHFDNATKWDVPHRAVLVPRKNLVLGLEDTASLGQLDPFYDKVSKNYIVDFGFSIDAKVGLDKYVQLAY